MVTHMPRSGSTMCMGLLHKHPHIVVAEHYPFEVKPATYYARAARVLRSLEIMRRPLAQQSLCAVRRILGLILLSIFRSTQYFTMNDFEIISLAILPNGTIFSALRAVSNDYYQHLAADQAKYEAAYFAEKCEVQGGVRDSIIALFPDVREILLIRDPRDLLCSNISYFKKPMNAMMSNIENGCKTIFG